MANARMIFAAMLSAALTIPHLATAAPEASVIVQPDWIRKPTATDLTTYYPRLASEFGFEGLVRMKCSVEASGAMRDCIVVAEAPGNLGFGPAALRMQGLFRMRPRTKDGQPTSGGEVTIPIAFRLPPPSLPAPAQPVDPDRLELAKRLIGLVPQISAMVEAVVDLPPLPDDGVTPADTRAAVHEALRTAIIAHRQDLFDVVARAAAMHFNREELQALLQSYSEGHRIFPTGETAEEFGAKLQQFGSAAEALVAPYLDQLTDEARAEYCKSHDCKSRP